MEQLAVQPYFLDSEEVKAIEQWYGSYYERLCEYVSSRIRNIEDVQDIVMEVMTKLCERPYGFNSELELKNYLYATTRLACERFNLEARHFKNFMSQYAESALTFEDKLLDDLIDKNHLDIIYISAQSLPQKYHLVFTLYFRYEFKNSVVARILGRDSSYIRLQRNKIVALLKAKISDRKVRKPVFKYFKSA